MAIAKVGYQKLLLEWKVLHSDRRDPCRCCRQRRLPAHRRADAARENAWLTQRAHAPGEAGWHSLLLMWRLSLGAAAPQSKPEPIPVRRNHCQLLDASHIWGYRTT